MSKKAHLITQLFEDFADCYAEWNRRECGAEPRNGLQISNLVPINKE